jgi:hypothetical protein
VHETKALHNAHPFAINPKDTVQNGDVLVEIVCCTIRGVLSNRIYTQERQESSHRGANLCKTTERFWLYSLTSPSCATRETTTRCQNTGLLYHRSSLTKVYNRLYHALQEALEELYQDTQSKAGRVKAYASCGHFLPWG